LPPIQLLQIPSCGTLSTTVQHIAIFPFVGFGGFVAAFLRALERKTFTLLTLVVLVKIESEGENRLLDDNDESFRVTGMFDADLRFASIDAKELIWGVVLRWGQ